MGKVATGILCGILAFFFLAAGVMEYVAVTPLEELPNDLRRLASFDDLGQGDDIVAMAQWELDYFQENNLSGGKRYWDMVHDALGWTFPDNTQWCVCFVLCCAYECGYIAEDGCFGDFSENNGNWIFWCGGLYNYLVNTTGLAVGYDTEGSYKPVPGDLIFFSPVVGSHSPDHIGIVKEVTESGAVITIEGNSHDSVRSNYYASYQIGSYAYSYKGYKVLISGYVHPFYPAAEEQETVPTTTETLENKEAA